jgi:hypothetical protein
MRDVTSKTIKAYARSIEGIKIALELDLADLGQDLKVDRFSKQLHEVAEDILGAARQLAEAEFNAEWEKS